MSIARVTEISSNSEKSFDDAMKNGIKRASKTIRNIEGAWIQDQKLIIKKGKISEYRVTMKVSFVLDD
jgi:flavin-binding protein dodecin